MFCLLSIDLVLIVFNELSLKMIIWFSIWFNRNDQVHNLNFDNNTYRCIYVHMYIQPVRLVQVKNYSEVKLTLADVKERVLKVVAAYDKITADKVTFY